MNCPGGVTTLSLECVRRALGPTGIGGEDVPRVPLDAILAGNPGVSVSNSLGGAFVGRAINHRVGIKVTGERSVRRGGSAVAPQRNDIVGKDLPQFVSEANPWDPRPVRDLVKRDAHRAVNGLLAENE
jgi:hypothetical protein